MKYQSLCYARSLHCLSVFLSVAKCNQYDRRILPILLAYVYVIHVYQTREGVFPQTDPNIEKYSVKTKILL